MDERRAFVSLARMEGSNRRELCRRFGISAQSGYKWLAREADGDRSFADRSRRPHTSPSRSTAWMEEQVLEVRKAHPVWGARKIGAVLAAKGISPPAVSTIHAILARHGRVGEPPAGNTATSRFEKEAPNLLWQMDFKGWTKLGNGERLHPLTVIDDHSRYALAIEAMGGETGAGVRERLERTFRRHGLPQAFYADNGNPWGDSHNARWTAFGVWLLKLGIELIHSRPYHPQGRGKNERFNRTLNQEVLDLNPLCDLAEAQRAFDRWRHVYNHERPHEALGLMPPASRYAMSPRPMPAKLHEPQYGSRDIVRKISPFKAYIVFKGHNWKIPAAFCGETLAIRPLDTDGHFGVFFAAHHIATIDLKARTCVNDVSEHL